MEMQFMSVKPFTRLHFKWYQLFYSTITRHWKRHVSHWRRQKTQIKTESSASSPDVHLVRAEAQQGVQHQTGGQVIGLTQLLHTHSSASVHRLPPSACCGDTGEGGWPGHHTRPTTAWTTCRNHQLQIQLEYFCCAWPPTGHTGDFWSTLAETQSMRL